MDRFARNIRELPLIGRVESVLTRFIGGGSLSEDDALAGIVRFVAMGLVSTLAYFVAALALLRYDVAPTRASLLAMLVGLAASFVVQSRVTFRREKFQVSDAIRFGTLGAVDLVLAHYAVVVVHQELGRPPWQAAVVVSVAVPLVNFTVMNFWVFTHR